MDDVVHGTETVLEKNTSQSSAEILDDVVHGAAAEAAAAEAAAVAAETAAAEAAAAAAEVAAAEVEGPLVVHANGSDVPVDTAEVAAAKEDGPTTFVRSFYLSSKFTSLIFLAVLSCQHL